MNKIILNEENNQLLFAQSLIDKSINNLLGNISNLESSNQQKLEYIASEKLDNLEKVEIYTDINKNDSYISANKDEIKILKRIRPKPFFARIEYEQNSKINSYYIGIKSISKDDNSLMILDWRTPICSLLYFSSLGPTYYLCENGKINVNLNLKRQFLLEPNRIINYFDTDTKIDDDILQQVLSKNSTNYMSNIVQTIQEDQNRIIRKDSKSNVIINGVAGSGKTSIAMHRLAYLLFVDKNHLTSKNILIISPNTLFSKYISDILPELGEENVETYTIDELYKNLNLLPKKFTSKINMINSEFKDNVRLNEINTKFSLQFKNYVDNYLVNFDVIPYIKAACSNICKFTDEDFTKVKMPKYNFNIKEKLYYIIEECLKNKYIALPMAKIENLTKRCVKLCNEILTPMEVLTNLYNSKNFHLNDQSVLNYEDIPVYAYISNYLNPINKDYFIKHIFIDEMQDYDAFSLDLIKNIFPDAIFTITGDYNQNIISNVSNIDILKALFPDTEIDKLDISYRSTYEIIIFAQNIIGNDTAQKFKIRNGEQPKVSKYTNDDEMINSINNLIMSYPNDKFAIIAKTEDEAIYLSKILPDFCLAIDNKNENLLLAKHLITTNYLSKGLEFDRVIIPNVTKENYCTEQDKYRLYVSCTRALHSLYLFYKGELSHFIK